MRVVAGVTSAALCLGATSAFLSGVGSRLQLRSSRTTTSSSSSSGSRRSRRTGPVNMILEELAPTDRKENMPAHIRRILQDPRAPQRVPENDERTQKIRGRAAEAAEDALAGTGFIEAAADKDAWWRTPLNIQPKQTPAS